MKCQLVTLLFVACGLISQAQQKNETYYKNYLLTKEVNEKKAKFKKVETLTEDGLLNIQVFNISKNCIIKEENYKDNNPVGIWTTNFEDCSFNRRRDFSKLVYSNKPIDTMFDNKIMNGNPDNYEKALFGDTKDAFFRYLAANVYYPSEAREAEITGKVYFQFIVMADGTVKMAAIVGSAHPLLDYEIWQVIENMPKWHPAKKDGQPIDSYYLQSLNFKVK